MEKQQLSWLKKQNKKQVKNRKKYRSDLAGKCAEDQSGIFLLYNR